MTLSLSNIGVRAFFAYRADKHRERYTCLASPKCARIVIPRAIMLPTNEDVDDEHESRRLVDVTKDWAEVGQPRESGFSSFASRAYIHAYTQTAGQASLLFFPSFLFSFSSLHLVGRRSGRGPL